MSDLIKKLDRKIAVVTGAGSGIGQGIALRFAQEGARLVIVDINPKSKETVQQIQEAGGEAIWCCTDLRKSNQIQKMVAESIKAFGRIDILVNNVGWDIPQLFTNTTPDFWDKVIAINYKSDIHGFKAVLPHMMEQKKGSIVSIASEAGRVGEFKESVYAGCKAGVIALSKAVAREVGRYGVRVNVICPGVVVPSPDEVGEASMWKGDVGKYFTPEVQQRAASAYPLRRLGKPDDLANAVLFMASDAADWITGQTLSVSGGYSMM